MSERRRMLLAIANSYKWLPYSYEYLYHNLIPEKIATFNKWNEEWELGYIDSTGNKASSGNIRSKDYIKVEPNGTYYFKCPISGNVFNVICYNADKQYLTTKYPSSNTTLTMPINCCYIRFYLEATYGTTYNHDICINESNASLNGTYIPYKPRYVKDQSKFLKFEGNSEVVNQLAKAISSDNYEAFNGTVTFSNGVATFTASQSSGFFANKSSIRPTIVVGHKYLISITLKLTTATDSVQFRVYDGQTYGNSQKYVQNTASKQTVYMLMTGAAADKIAIRLQDNRSSGFDAIQIYEILCIDLTQRYPFDTPTTLTDSRVQNIICKGYIPYNTGEIKDTDMGGDVARSFNIWNEEWEYGYYSRATGEKGGNDTQYLRCADFIPVLPNTTYYNAVLLTHPDNINIIEYDENKKLTNGYLRGVSNTTFTTSSRGRYITFFIDTISGSGYNHDICINRSSSLNGTYKPHDDFVDLAHFNPIDINGIHDEFKALDSGYLFRKKTMRYVFTGNEEWVWSDNNSFWYCNLPSYISSVQNTRPNISNGVKAIFQGSLRTIRCYNSENPTITSSTDMNSVFPSGTTLDYELATYQTTNMPLRHLGMVKLKDLTWEKIGTSPNIRFQASVSGFKKTSANTDIPHVYCSKYTNVAQSNWYSYDRVIFAMTNEINVDIKDSQYNDYTADQFKNHFTDDDYLYFETADITDETNILTYTGTLPLKYQGSGFGTSHDTMEETNTEWVFTRNNWKYTFSGNETLTTDTGMFVFSANGYNASGIFLCSKNYQVVNNWGALLNTDKAMYGLNNGSNFYFHDNSCSTTTDFVNLMKGETLTYKLATPQITRIPKKYIGAYTFNGNETCSLVSGNQFLFSGLLNINSRTGIYISNYLTQDLGESGTWTSLNNVSIARHPTIVDTFRIRDDSCSTTTDLLNKLRGHTIYYETTTESTLPDTFSIQAGGEVSSYAFEWVENQQVKTNDFQSGTSNGITFTNNGDGTITASGTASGYAYRNKELSFINGHVYLIFGIKNGSSSSYGMTVNSPVVYEYGDGLIFTANASTSILYLFVQNGYAIAGTITFTPQVIDLTQAFGSGKEPTSTSDPRIQRIIEKGYIPTNTNGTLVYEETEVLPNATFKDKCK